MSGGLIFSARRCLLELYGIYLCIFNPAPPPTLPCHSCLNVALFALFCVAEIDALMRAALRPVLVQVSCLAARVSPAACPWRLRSRPCVPSPAVGVPGLGVGLGRATILNAETSAGLLHCSALAALRYEVNATPRCGCAAGLGLGLGFGFLRRVGVDMVSSQVYLLSFINFLLLIGPGMAHGA